MMGAYLLYAFTSEVLETTLVRALADGPLADAPAYFAVRNQPLVLAAKVVFGGLMGILAGYMSAKVAGAEEMGHGAATAAIQTAAMVYGYTAGEFAAFTPIWARVVLVLTTGPAVLAGAAIRRKARLALDEGGTATGGQQ